MYTMLNILQLPVAGERETNKRARGREEGGETIVLQYQRGTALKSERYQRYDAGVDVMPLQTFFTGRMWTHPYAEISAQSQLTQAKFTATKSNSLL